MKCNYCGTENHDELLFCVECGQPLKRSEEPELEPELEEELEEVFEFESEEPAEAQPKKKSPIALIVTIGVVAVALVVMVLLLVRHAIPAADASDEGSGVPLTGEVVTPSSSPATNTPTATPAYPVTAYTSPALVPAEAMSARVATFGGENGVVVDNRALNYFYWGEFNYLNNYYGSALYQWMNPGKPLGEQGYNGAMNFTWQDALLENAAESIEETYALIWLAREAGFGLTEEDLTYIDQMTEQMRSAAAQYGYMDLESYLQSAYGSGATEETFDGFMEDSLLASNYANHLYGSFSYTDEEISAYYDAGDYAASGLAQSDERNIDVRHILIQTRVDDNGVENWELTLSEAEDILGLWSSSPTEEHFAALAEEYTEDPGSQATGGLYTGVYRGQMVPAFNDWCFDAARQPGDTGIVQTNYGYHIMYFVAHADRPAWMETVEADMRAEAYSNALAEVVAQQGFEIDYSAVVLAPPVGLYE